ncbi:MAG: hypothetical protein AMXMBFR61_01140 [Fimbriimonadales bacterium]
MRHRDVGGIEVGHYLADAACPGHDARDAKGQIARPFEAEHLWRQSRHYRTLKRWVFGKGTTKDGEEPAHSWTEAHAGDVRLDGLPRDVRDRIEGSVSHSVTRLGPPLPPTPSQTLPLPLRSKGRGVPKRRSCSESALCW